ncbi:15472_t:CDS:2, partial [Dentiscutata heterogama]
IKTIALRKNKNAARIFFLKLTDPDSSNTDTEIPENITIEDYTDQIEECVRIYQMNFEKKIQIYRFPKNESVLLTGTHEEEEDEE